MIACCTRCGRTTVAPKTSELAAYLEDLLERVKHDVDGAWSYRFGRLQSGAEHVARSLRGVCSLCSLAREAETEFDDVEKTEKLAVSQ